MFHNKRMRRCVGGMTLVRKGLVAVGASLLLVRCAQAWLPDFRRHRRGASIPDTFLTHFYNPFLCMAQQIHFIEVTTRHWVPVFLLAVVRAKLVVAGRHT